MKPAPPPSFEVDDNGDITITTDCSPMTQPHVYVWPLAEAWEVVLRARARQLGSDPWRSL